MTKIADVLNEILAEITEQDITKLLAIEAITLEEARCLRQMCASDEDESIILARKIIKEKFKMHNDGKSE